MDLKLIFAILASVTALIAYFPYIRDMLAKKTKPHVYTWLIWLLTQGTAALGIFYGGGNWGGLYLAVMCVEIIVVFLLSFKYGTKNITKGDTIILVSALIAIFVWWQLKQPLLSVFMVSAIDVIGYIPSFRKSFKDPWSETLVSWFLFALANILGILALGSYNLLTTTYLISIFIANTSLFLFCFLRRHLIKPRENLIIT